jgi:hypothetical protein
MVGMTYLEGRTRRLLESLEWASETLSTTGYGKDPQLLAGVPRARALFTNPWSSRRPYASTRSRPSQ